MRWPWPRATMGRMLAELATAAVWQATASAAAGSLEEAEDAVDVAIAVALPAYVRCAALNIQVHGGIGNTWECLAHVYLRRALLSSDILGGAGASLDRVLDHHGIGGLDGLR